MDWMSIITGLLKKQAPLTLAVAMFIQFVIWLYFYRWAPPPMDGVTFTGGLIISLLLATVIVAAYSRLTQRDGQGGEPVARTRSKRTQTTDDKTRKAAPSDACGRRMRSGNRTGRTRPK